MSDKRSPSEENTLPPLVLSSFDDEEQEEVKDLWDALEGANSRTDSVSPQETDRDLEDLHIRLGFSGRSDRIAGLIRTYGRYAAAAVAIIVAGAAFLMLPHSVEVPPGKMAVVSLPDGSQVELNSGSVIQFNRLFGVTNRDISLSGEGYFEVVPGDMPFEVTSNGTVTEVLGTTFNIRSWSDHPQNETIVAVKEGIVKFYPVTNIANAVRLNEADESRWQAGFESPTAPANTDLERVTGWRERKFIFYEESLQQIFREVERRFDLDIDLENREAANETLTGYYGEVSNPESLLDDICTVAGLSYSKTANGYRVY